MGDQQPQQLQIPFPRVDEGTPEYPRVHHERHLRTAPELAAETARVALTATSEGLRKAYASKTVRRTAVLCAFAGYALTVGTNNQQAQEQSDSKQEAPYLQNSIDCSKGIPVTPNDFKLEISEDFKNTIEQTSVIGGNEWRQLRSTQRNAKDLPVQEAANMVVEAFAKKGVHVRFALNLEKEAKEFSLDYASTGPLTRRQLEILAVALNSIPKSLYTYAGITEIVIQEEITTKKSPEQLLIETSSMPPHAVIDTKEYFSGRFTYPTGVVHLRRAALFDIYELTGTLWHEVVGHGVFMKLCDPQVDAAWQGINKSAGIPFTYMPAWQRTPEQEALMSAGILVASSYGGTKPSEDVAEVSELFGPSIPYYEHEAPSPSNGTVLDEKTTLLLQRLNEIEPNIEQFLSLQRFLVATEFIT